MVQYILDFLIATNTRFFEIIICLILSINISDAIKLSKIVLYNIVWYSDLNEFLYIYPICTIFVYIQRIIHLSLCIHAYILHTCVWKATWWHGIMMLRLRTSSDACHKFVWDNYSYGENVQVGIGTCKK